MRTGTAAVQAMLVGMPEPEDLHRAEVDGQVLVMVGARVVYSYAATDAQMRNLAAVTLPGMGFTARRVAGVLGITEQYLSMLRARVAREGSAALTRDRGRPPALGAGQLRRARAWRAQGMSDTAIGKRLGVHATTVARALVGTARPGQETTDGDDDVQDVLPLAGAADGTEGLAGDTDEVAGADEGDQAADADEAADVDEADGEVLGTGSARVSTGTFRCRYAGAMLVHGFTDRVGAGSIFGTLAGAPARRYDDLAVLTSATLAFALGAGTVEGTKHLPRAQAGPLAGLVASPQLATLRSRLWALAEGCDPLAVQRAFAAGMLATDPAGDPVYFVDDHFVPYAGARPVAKGWNTKRRHAQPGRDDTHLVDARGRAVVFGSGEPTGLSSTLPGVLAQLREVIGESAPVLLAFDRGGAHPVTFTAARKAGAHWLTYRRAPLVAASAEPATSSTVRDGRRVSMVLADETVQLKNYGPARQLTLYEHDQPVLQVLTSQTTASGADLVCWLRSRWRIENMFKYAAQHNGIDALACYDMDTGPDDRKVANPARTAARSRVRTAEAELVLAERALPQLLNNPDMTPKEKNAALPGAHAQIRAAQAVLDDAKADLRPIPAKVSATDLDPDAKRARPHLARRGLQMVLRLLAFNAEAWLAEHLNAYLNDNDEYRAITRNLLHQDGTITYTPDQIIVTIDRPDSPRVTRALTLLLDELNNTPPRLPGDPRPITYRVSDPSTSTPTAPQLEEV